MLRVFQIALSAVATLLVVPFAVNISTGGDPPGWMRPFVGWLWPVAIGCVVAVIVLEAVDRLAPAAHDKVIRHRVGDPRNVPLALAQVTRYVSARQQGSLAERVRIALALDERPAAVRQPAHLVARVSGDVFTLSPDLGIGDVFGQLNESMLILGAPGAGKTTQLLDLAAALVDQAHAAGEPFVPVLLDLADWVRPRRRRFTLPGSADERPALDDWIVEAMARRYLIGPQIGAAWLHDDRIVLLLDGLDEVTEEDRARCVAEINALGVTRVAVCCREADYDQVGARLRLQGAVTIRPLTRDQVRAFLTAADPSLAEVMAGLDADDELWDVLTTPLMLSITVLANADRAAFAGSAEPAARRRLLFDAYVVEVLSRRRAGRDDDPARTLAALRNLADGATRGEAGVRVVAFDGDSAYRILPDRALNLVQSVLLPISAVAVAGWCTVIMAARTGLAATVLPALFGLTVVSVFAAVPPAVPVRNRAVLAGYAAAAFVTVGVVACGLLALAGLVPPEPAGAAATALGVALLSAATMWWFDRAAMDVTSWVLVAVCTGAGVLAAAGILLLGYSPVAGAGWAVGAVTTAGFATLSAIIGTIPQDRTTEAEFGRRALVLLAVFVAGTAAALALTGLGTGSFWAATTGWLVGMTNGVGLAFAVIDVISRWVARVGMAVDGEPSPWRRSFLRFAADRGLLTYTDGEYRFIHLLVRDHLAAVDPLTLAAQVDRRKAELTAPSIREPVA
ncbi:hypothetical protein AB0J74_26505 [Asanoa sp. NPDC049573]|uniref:hypothetical protein n=1 Tax=Asanoa sp. NPDC049573 TaxID=3155396 RepID=UPI0034245D60